MTNNHENLLTIPQVAARLNVQRMTVYRMIKAGKIQAVRIGRLWRIRPAELEAYIQAGTVTAARATNTNGGGAGE